ncbi:MAG: D-alanine--D-alanine ligase, partial [Planctomycetaceae bacterium]
AGTEWTLGLLDDKRLPLIRIETRQPFYDFLAKYEDEQTSYCLDHDVPSEALRAIEEAGAAACRAVGTQGIARVDLRVDRKFRPWVLEVNTVPGFTDHSLVPKAAARLGWTLGELCERAVRSCLRSRSSGLTDSQNGDIQPASAPLREAG